MIPVCQDEILVRPAGTDFTLPLHGGIKFHHGKAGQLSSGFCLDLFIFSFNFLLKLVLNYFFIPFRRAEPITKEDIVGCNRRIGIVYEEFIALPGSRQNGAEFHPGQPGSCNHVIIRGRTLVIIITPPPPPLNGHIPKYSLNLFVDQKIRMKVVFLSLKSF